MSSQVRVYLAISIDGFIAGPNHSLDWLMEVDQSAECLANTPEYLEFDQLMSQVGCLLMGRKSFDVIQSLGQWVYGETPVIVATHREFVSPRLSVRAQSGTVSELITQAKALAKDKDVYLDGGSLVRQGIEEGWVDEITLTYLPVILGQGVKLFHEFSKRSDWRFKTIAASGKGHVQITATRMR